MAARIKLAASVAVSADPTKSAAQAIALEDAGIDVIGVAEAYGTDAVSMLGYLAGMTSRVELMSQILPLYSRTPTLTAMTAVGLDQLCGGRFILGLGASGPQVVEGWHGVPYDAPLARTREVVEICRSVWRRDVLQHDGKYYKLPLPAEQGTGLGKALKIIGHPVRERIPIYLAALGDKNVELTAEIAEGWMPTLYIAERADSVWGQSLKRGFEKRDAALGSLQISAGGAFAIGSDVTHLRDLARGHIALYVGGMGARGKNFYNDIAVRYGFEQEAEVIQDLYLDGKKQEAAAAVPDALLEGVTLIGDEAYVRDRLQAMVAAGVTTLQVGPVGADPLGDVRRLRELVEDL